MTLRKSSKRLKESQNHLEKRGFRRSRKSSSIIGTGGELKNLAEKVDGTIYFMHCARREGNLAGRGGGCKTYDKRKGQNNS